MIQFQSIPTTLLTWSARNKRTTLLRDYLKFRAVAFNNGSYSPRPQWMSTGRMKDLVDIGWVKRVNKNHYQFVSVYKIALDLGLSISLRTTIETKKCEVTASAFRAYILAKSEAIIYNSSIYCRKLDRDGVTNKGNAKRWSNSFTVAVRYAEKAIGFSKSSVSSYRRNNPHNIYNKKYCEEFDGLNFKRKEQVSNYVSMLRYADLNAKEKEAKKNIVYCNVLKKYRLITATEVCFNPFSTINEFTVNRSNRTYRRRYIPS